MIKILIADDHPIVRMGLKQILNRASGISVVDEARDGQEALNKAWKNNYDVVVLDVSLPGISGLDVLKQLKNKKPKLPILILSIHPEEQYAIRTLKAGAAGYLTKESAPEELIAAIYRVSQGRKFISASLAEKMAYDLQEKNKALPHEALSDREYQVMRLLALGKTGKDIAGELLLSVKTVNTYRARVMDKMQMKNNAQIIRYAIQNRLV